jgi:FkbM family methyltransferase
MYYLKEGSLTTDTPIFQRLDENGLFFPERQIAYDFARSKNYEHSLIQWAAEMMPPSKVFLDIGAHVGTWSLAFARKCAKVHSFEPTPRTFHILCGNIALTNLDDRIVPHNLALADTKGRMPIYKSSEDGGGNSLLPLLDRTPTWMVDVTTLDSFGFTNVGMIKVDVEGFEKNVLQGAQETLKANGYPPIFFESWVPQREGDGIPSKSLRSELFDYVKSTGYEVVPIRGYSEMFIAEYRRTVPTTSE